jgi:hypothetical protein
MTNTLGARDKGPHQAIGVRSDRERFTLELFDVLWDRYRQRVSYVAAYEQVIQQAGATFVNDHIAFRTFACQRPMTGIASLSRIFEALDYQAAGCYQFADKQLGAIHYQHTNPQFPKLFISELKVWELDPNARKIILQVLQSHREPLDEETLSALFARDGRDSIDRAALLDRIVRQFHELPWDVPEKKDVTALNQDSQYAAWVLVHGYNVNHFTSLINSHGVESLNSIEKTVDALRDAGVPMKAEIEGQPGSKLRQTATEAVHIDVEVREQARAAKMPWTYAYFELAERGEITDPESGKRGRFEGFLGPQATHLFEMTKVTK